MSLGLFDWLDERFPWPALSFPTWPEAWPAPRVRLLQQLHALGPVDDTLFGAANGAVDHAYNAGQSESECVSDDAGDSLERQHLLARGNMVADATATMQYVMHLWLPADSGGLTEAEFAGRSVRWAVNATGHLGEWQAWVREMADAEATGRADPRGSGRTSPALQWANANGVVQRVRQASAEAQAVACAGLHSLATWAGGRNWRTNWNEAKGIITPGPPPCPGLIAMPLHDWSALSGWDGVHQVWMVELLYALKAALPPGYRAYIGTTPTFAIGAPDDGRPDVGVRNWPTDEPRPPGSGGSADLEPDEEVAVATINPDTAVMVERGGRLVAAIELVSPRNKDRLSSQAAYTAAYAGYLLRGVHLLLVDVHRKPLAFSFADHIAAELGVNQPPVSAPFAVGYRVGGPVPTGGRMLAVWRRPLATGEPLSPMRLWLSADESVAVDLDGTYRRASEAAYLG